MHLALWSADSFCLLLLSAVAAVAASRAWEASRRAAADCSMALTAACTSR